MTALDEYLSGRYLDDCGFLEILRLAIAETVPLFYLKTDKLALPSGGGADNLTWPYAVGGSARKLDVLSPSTHCMILFALDSIIRAKSSDPSPLLRECFRPIKLPKSVNVRRLELVLAGAQLSIESLVDAATSKWGKGDGVAAKVERRPAGSELLKSSTYGADDPFTLTWLVEALFRTADPTDAKERLRLAERRAAVISVASETLNRTPILNTKETGFHEAASCFLDLRLIHLAATLTRQKKDKETSKVGVEWTRNRAKSLWERFNGQLQRHLAYAATADSRLDLAELAFALEGALLIHPTWVNPGVVDAAFKALRLTGTRHPYWRPTTPILGNAKGHVLFLISIEVANSILRSCELLDRDDPRHRHFSQMEPELRLYSKWLLDEREETEILGPGKATRAVGWRSEYEEKTERGTIFLWYTSHVLVFLAHYHGLLQAKIASNAADAAGLTVKKPSKRFETFFKDEPLAALVGSLDGTHRALTAIYQDFVDARQDLKKRTRAASSMILYGPPGTGKTTVAEQLAERLGQRLIVVTVSDFLAAGATELENRAKGIFEVLRAQRDMVILFDEIDQFLLDRNTKLYAAQDDVFKFMTPGMLTKLQDLRDAEDSIFIVATNYYERMDGAIRRPGRIDQRYLLSIPDQQRRAALICEFVKGVVFDLDQVPADDQEAKKWATEIEKYCAQLTTELETSGVLRETALFGYGDLKNLVEQKAPLTKGMTPGKAAEAIYEVRDLIRAAVSIESYDARFNVDSPHPFEEFFLVVYLALEAHPKLSLREIDVLAKALATVHELKGGADLTKLPKDGIKRYGLLEALINEHKAVISAALAARPVSKQAEEKR